MSQHVNGSRNGFALVRGMGRVLDLSASDTRRTFSRLNREAWTGFLLDRSNMRRDWTSAVHKTEKS